MGRKITMTGKNAQYVEHRGVNATPDNDREIRMEGDEAVYQEYAYGQASQPKQEDKPTEEAVKAYQKEAARKLLMDNAKYVEPIITNPEKIKIVSEKEAGETPSSGGNTFELDPKTVEKCFKFQSDFLIDQVKTVLNDYYHGNYANLALIEITLFHHQQLKKRNNHTWFVMSLAVWGLITVSTEEEFDRIVYGVGDKYKRMPKEGYQNWDDDRKDEKLFCERVAQKLGLTMPYQE
jgi:hypothetical protein